MALIDAIIIHGEFVLINIQKEVDDIKEEIEKFIVWIADKIKTKNREFVKTKNKIIVILLKYAVGNCKKSKFLKEQEARELLSNIMELKIPIFRDLSLINTLF